MGLEVGGMTSSPGSWAPVLRLYAFQEASLSETIHETSNSDLQGELEK